MLNVIETVFDHRRDQYIFRCHNGINSVVRLKIGQNQNFVGQQIFNHKDQWAVGH